MTWYWWSHWFWITVIVVTLATFPIISTETYPMNPPYGNKEYDKDKPLEFPIAAQTDHQDPLVDGDEILTTAIREGRYLRNNKESDHNINVAATNDDLNGKHIHVTNASSHELLASKSESNINQTEPSKVHRTKAVDVSLVNVSNSNNHSSNAISDKDSVKEQPKSLGVTGTPSSTIRSDIDVDDEQDPNITDTHPDTNQTDVNAFDSNESNLAASTEDHLQNQTLTLSPISSHPSSALSSLPSLKSSSSSSSSSSSNIELFIDDKSSYKKSFSLENITKEEEFIRAEIEKQLDGERGRKSKVLAEYRQEFKFINFSSNTKNLLARSAAVSLEDLIEQDDDKVSSEALSIQRAYVLDAGAISGICFAVLSTFCGVIIAAVALYRRRYLNKPQTLSEPDSSGYIDDSTIRDNSDEMYSLDNDSFLNSLEAMTIQNYWTDTVKHTKL